MTTATTSRKATATKTVQIIARVQYKSDSRKVVYLVRSHKGDATYQTTMFDGKATSCTCPAQKPCYHMVQLEQKEQASMQREIEEQIEAEQAVAEAEAMLTSDADVDEEYEQWKRDNGLDVALGREEYASFFDVHGYEL